MKHFVLSNTDFNYTGVILIYNPDKWKYSEYYFFKQPPHNFSHKIYKILHLSM